MLLYAGDDIAYSNNESISYGRVVSISEQSTVVRVYSLVEDEDLEDDSILLLNYRKLFNTQQIQTINVLQFVEFLFIVDSTSITSHLYNLEGVSNVFYATDVISPHPIFDFHRFCSSLFL